MTSNLTIDDDGLGVTFTVGGKTVHGRLPLITAALDFAAEMSLARDEAQKTDRWSGLLYVQTAAIGLCWQGPGLKVGHLRRDFGRNMEDYGEAIRAAIITAGVARLKALPAPKKKRAKKKKEPTELELMFAEIDSVAAALATQIYALVPSQEEVDEAREDFTDPLSGDSSGVSEGATQADAPEEASG